MSIQTGEGPIRVDPDDLQFSYRGKTIAVKIRQMAWPVVIGVQKMADGSWQVGADLDDSTFVNDPPGGGDPVAYWIAHHGGAMGFVRAVVLPRLNAWLAELFPAGGDPVPPLEQVHGALGAIRFVPQADGTLQAVLS